MKVGIDSLVRHERDQRSTGRTLGSNGSYGGICPGDNRDGGKLLSVRMPFPPISHASRGSTALKLAMRLSGISAGSHARVLTTNRRLSSGSDALMDNARRIATPDNGPVISKDSRSKRRSLNWHRSLESVWIILHASSKKDGWTRIHSLIAFVSAGFAGRCHNSSAGPINPCGNRFGS